VNEKAVLENKSVEQELFRRHYVLLRADWTRYDPEITAALNRVGRSGVPTYVVFSGTRAGSPHVLPEFLTRNVVLDAIRQTGA
jgi:thiol:disulfide interchange protein DsbD